MSTLKVDTIQNTSGVTNNRILQVQYSHSTSPVSQSYTAGTALVPTGLTVDITPTSSSSIILLQARWNGEFATYGLAYNSVFYFRRDSTRLGAESFSNRLGGMSTPAISYQTEGSSTSENATVMWVDSPATTSQITYALNFEGYTNGTVYTNRTVSDADNNQYERTISMIIAMEIAQ
jgi:hypothetical protein